MLLSIGTEFLTIIRAVKFPETRAAQTIVNRGFQCESGC